MFSPAVGAADPCAMDHGARGEGGRSGANNGQMMVLGGFQGIFVNHSWRQDCGCLMQLALEKTLHEIPDGVSSMEARCREGQSFPASRAPRRQHRNPWTKQNGEFLWFAQFK